MTTTTGAGVQERVMSARTRRSVRETKSLRPVTDTRNIMRPWLVPESQAVCVFYWTQHSSGSNGQVEGVEKHEIYAAAFGGHLFYYLFLQGRGAWLPRPPIRYCNISVFP